MALIRIVVLALFVLLVFRLLVRLLSELGRRTGGGGAGHPHGVDRGDAAARSRPRPLVACPVCRTYFEESRGVPAAVASSAGPRLVVCSEGCRERYAGSARDGGAG